MTPAENIVAPLEARVITALREAWAADTSASPNWSADLPESGQCAVTALVVQDIFGGTLRRALVNGAPHYWNVLPSGEEVDCTRAQFSLPLTVDTPIERERAYLFESSATGARYALLVERFNAALSLV